MILDVAPGLTAFDVGDADVTDAVLLRDDSAGTGIGTDRTNLVLGELGVSAPVSGHGGLTEVRPCEAALDLGYGDDVEPVGGSDVGVPAGIREDRPDLLLGELGPRMILPFGSVGVLWPTEASLGDGVLGVVSVAAEEQVAWVHAPTHVAGVAHNLTGRNRSHPGAVGHTVGGVVDAFGEGHVAVAVGTNGPRPEPTVGGLVDTGLETGQSTTIHGYSVQEVAA